MINNEGKLKFSLFASPLQNGRRAEWFFEWSAVESALEETFLSGGTISLRTNYEYFEPSYYFVQRDSISMMALPGRFRLAIFPFECAGEKSKVRDWWQPDSVAYEGTVRFGEDECDNRLICEDLDVAKRLFKEFFTEKAITDVLINSTRSAWNPKPKS